MKKRFITQLLFFFCLAVGTTSAQTAPNFNQHIAPLMYEYCAACHHPKGSAPFSLLTYRDVKKRAKQIAEVTRTRYMPPWLPEPNPHKIADERRLSEAQIKRIQQWLDAGMPEGNAKDLPPAPRFNEGWQLGKPDLIVKMPEAFDVPAESRNTGNDVFRNFVLPLPVTTTKYIRAVEILPGNKQLVHHANLLIDRTGNARRLDAQDTGPGFGGMEITTEADSFDPESHFLFWKPGSVPFVEPPGMAWRCDPGTDLILNIHLQPTGKPEKIQAEIGLYFSDQPQTIFPMLLQLEHDGNLDIPAGKKDFVVTDEFTLPIDVDLLGVYPHAHYLGKDLLGAATLPDGKQIQLIHIKDWDLNWQAVFKYAQPIFLPKGSVVKMRYSYDNSATNPRNPQKPPKSVLSGNNSTDEMGHLWLQVLPRRPTINGVDARVFLQEAVMRRRLEKYPNDFTAHFNLAAALQTRGANEEAILEFQRALAVKPDDAAAHTNLAVLLQSLGTGDPLIHYQQALRARPDYFNARYNFGNLLLGQEQVAEALIQLREAVRLQPNDAGAHNSLGAAFVMQGDVADAAEQFQKSLQLEPNNADTHSNYAAVLANQGNFSAAIQQYEEALRINPNSADNHNELGALLGRQRKIPEALAHFEQALKLNPNHAAAQENLQRARRIK